MVHKVNKEPSHSIVAHTVLPYKIRAWVHNSQPIANGIVRLLNKRGCRVAGLVWNKNSSQPIANGIARPLNKRGCRVAGLMWNKNRPEYL